MTIENALREKGLYDVSEVRHLKFHVSFLSNDARRLGLASESQNKVELQRKLNFCLNNLSDPPIEEMNTKVLLNFLSDKSFHWIDKSEDRINYFVWSMLRLVTYREVDEHENKFGYKLKLKPCLENLDKRKLNPYRDSRLNTLPLNKNEMRELIFDFFDGWDVKASAKEMLMKKLRREWIYITNELDPDYSWIEKKNKKQNFWIYKYLKSKDYFLPHFIKPVSTTQVYNTNIAILDSFFVLTDGEITIQDSEGNDLQVTYDEIMHKMMKAWKQQLYREKKDKTKS
ncbi:hypothetical protein [Vibrio harveyi]|uniref:hypothetical protein n=1 Tax=Vibrio harveyi TaxID=669 RepID=UPI003AACB7BD